MMRKKKIHLEGNIQAFRSINSAPQVSNENFTSKCMLPATEKLPVPESVTKMKQSCVTGEDSRASVFKTLQSECLFSINCESLGKNSGNQMSCVSKYVQDEIKNNEDSVRKKQQNNRMNTTTKCSAEKVSPNSQTLIEVLIAYSKNPDELWLLKKANILVLQQITSELSSEKHAILHSPFVGSLCAILYHDIWCRAQVTKVYADGLCEVFCIDYGNEEVMKPSEVYMLPKKLTCYPPQAHPCKLSHIQPQNPSESWTHENLEMYVSLLSLLSKNKLFVCGKQMEDKREVDFFSAEGLNIAEKMVTSGNAKWSEEKEVYLKFFNSADKVSSTQPNVKHVVQPINEPCLPQPLTVSSIITVLKVGDHLTLTPTKVNHNSCSFWAVVKNSLLLTELNEKCISSDIDDNVDIQYRAKDGEIVAAFSLCDRQWHRAYILSPESSGYMVRYIDYGTDEVVSLVHPLKHDHFTAVSPALNCVAFGISAPVFSKYLSASDCALHVRVKDVVPNRSVQFAFCNSELNTPTCELLGFPWDLNLNNIAHAKFSQSNTSTSVSSPESNDTKHLHSQLKIRDVNED